MNEIFSMDNAFFRFMGRLTDLVWLNILTLICCIPLFTAGAAISAMYRVLLRMALKEDGVITKTFFRAFKENFKNTTIVWVPSMIVLLILFSNAYLIYQGVLDGYGNLVLFVGISIGIIALAIFMILNYALPLFARFDSDLKQTLKNSGLLTIAFFPRTVSMLIIWLFPIALMMLSDIFLYFWFLYGFCVPGLLNSILLGRIFEKIEGTNKSGQEEVQGTDIQEED